jgi:hypothetical protein
VFKLEHNRTFTTATFYITAVEYSAVELVSFGHLRRHEKSRQVDEEEEKQKEKGRSGSGQG